MKQSILFITLAILLILAFMLDLTIGSATLSIGDIWGTLTGSDTNPIYSEVIFNYRLPKALTAILAGTALSLAGVLMQTLFHNPLAGPDVLGVTSGAGLGVAILTMCTSTLPLWFVSGWGQVIAASLGAALVLLLVIVVSIKIPQTTSLLIIGMMFGYFAGAIISIMQSASNPDTLKLFITWTFGSLAAVGWSQLAIMTPIVLCGVFITMLLQKQLNILLLGHNYASGLGVSVFRLRLWIILATALLAGVSTAFTGPIAFIGITMPHIARGLFKTSNHRIVLPASILCGSIVLLICDCLSQLPGFQGTLPINAVTSLIGAPIIIWIILKNRGN